MVATGPIIGGAVIGGLGVLALLSAKNSYARYSTVSSLAGERDSFATSEQESTVTGEVAVKMPARPDPPPPDAVHHGTDSVAVWAWRVRRKIRTGQQGRGRSRWRTIQSGLALGNFTIDDDGESVAVDGSWLEEQFGGPADASPDPFESGSLYLGQPTVDVALGELDPITKRLERWGVIGEDGILSSVEFTISIGRATLTPDRYQAAIVDDGEELFVRGDRNNGDDQPVIRGSADKPLVLATGDLDRQASRFRARATKYGIVGVALVAIGTGIVGMGLV